MIARKGVLLLLAVSTLFLSTVAESEKPQELCDESACIAVLCPEGVGLVKDSSSPDNWCCDVCAGALGDDCGGPHDIQCDRGLVCAKDPVLPETSAASQPLMFIQQPAWWESFGACQYPEEIHMCQLNIERCNYRGECVPNGESFTCRCIDGWLGDTCDQKDPCGPSWSPGSGACLNGGVCTSQENGGFNCECLPGYGGDICENEDECFLGSHNCHSNAICTNTDESFQCTCNDGYQGDGVSCTAVVNGCHDNETGTEYSVNQRFTKIDANGEQSCNCDSTGEIVCLKDCTVPEPSMPIFSRLDDGRPSTDGCYDKWNQQWYVSGSYWDRQKLMNGNVDPPIYGTYRCSCSYGRTRCSARNIPCCDRRTGEYVGGGSSFFTNLRGKDYTCTCRMGRGSFSNCVSGNPVTHSAGSRPVIPASGGTGTTGRYYPYPNRGMPSEVTCRDRYNPGRRYKDGQSWIQWRTRGAARDPWTCTCSVQGRRGRTRCQWGYKQNV